METEAKRSGQGIARKPGFVRRLIGLGVAVVATLIAAVAVVLPWKVRSEYARLLRWFRNLLMQNSKAVRRWALKKRWEWDSQDMP